MPTVDTSNATLRNNLMLARQAQLRGDRRTQVAAVKAFQASHHLKADGIIGPKTNRALDRYFADGFDSNSTKATGTKPAATTKGVPEGVNASNWQAVKNINIQQYHRRGSTTYCNQAFTAYAKQKGVTIGGMANDMYKHMNAGHGWKKVSASEAMDAAKAGKLVAASWYSPGKHGHVSAVIGEHPSGVPAIAQAGTNTFEYGPITATRKNPTYFVHN
ncbi:MAG: peptidoglycan-binding domain-containing protein [Myxococcales bacterium]